MQGNEYTLPNGLRIIHEPTLSKVAYCGFAIDAGTRDEAENEQNHNKLLLRGLVHGYARLSASPFP